MGFDECIHKSKTREVCWALFTGLTETAPPKPQIARGVVSCVRTRLIGRVDSPKKDAPKVVNI
jgi:hypothetical protein